MSNRIREKARVDWDDFVEGLQATPEPTQGLSPRAKVMVGWAAVGFRVVLFGFLVVDPGIGMLPWGEPGGWGLALLGLAASLAMPAAKGTLYNLAIAGAVLAGVGVVALADSVSTSLVFAGAVIAVVVQLAQARPWTYLAVALAGLVGLVTLFFQSTPRGAELIFSAAPYSPNAAGRDLLLGTAIVLLTGGVEFFKREGDREKGRADAAEAALHRAASDERARIARELHDVVSHHVAAMTLQAEAAAATGDRDALTALAATGREAAGELRRMLGVLRKPSVDAPFGDADAPQPRLGDVDRLVERMGSGLEVAVDRQGRVRPLPPGVELCAYRLIQEALTNVTKHSTAPQASVTLIYAAKELTIEILDDGAEAGSRLPGSGQGLVGMEERVRLLDGQLEAGPRVDGPGFRILARIPISA